MSTVEMRVRPGVRVDLDSHAAGFTRAMGHLDRAATKALDEAGFDPGLADLARLRASQLNGCAYCVDLHTREAGEKGEPPERVAAVAAWRESGWFTATERAVLELTEDVTRLCERPVPDATYDRAAALLGDDQVAALLALLATINAWNILAVVSRTWPAGPG